MSDQATALMRCFSRRRVDVAGNCCRCVPGQVTQRAVKFRPKGPSPKAYPRSLLPILAAPFVETDKLPSWRVAHTECAIIMFQAFVNC